MKYNVKMLVVCKATSVHLSDILLILIWGHINDIYMSPRFTNQGEKRMSNLLGPLTGTVFERPQKGVLPQL